MTFNSNQEELQQTSEKTKEALKDTRRQLEELNKEFAATAKTIKDNFSKSLVDAINGGDTFSNTFKNVRKTLEDLAVKTAIANPLSDLVFGGNSARLDSVSQVSDVLPAQGRGGLLGDLTNSLADLFGARAFGGPVGAGQPYLVGERGPELFIPQTAGRINPDIGAGAVNITMNISTQDVASFQASQNQITASMIDAARKAQRIR